MTRPVPKPKGEPYGAASTWYARMSSDVCTPADEAAFDAWLAQSPEHGEAYAETCALAGRFDAIADHPDIAALKVEAQLFEERCSKPALFRFRLAPTVTGLVFAACVSIFFHLDATSVERHAWSTARGEVREIHLSDGSDITLGSDTRLEVVLRPRRREITLNRGQAFFDVEHDATRPFIVMADGRSVTALGTAFDVRSYQNETTVTLVRGRVAIARPGERNDDAVLAPGQQFRVAFGVTSVRDVDAVAETSWRSGVLDFNGLTLQEAVESFNRSAPHALIIGDPRLAGLRVSGVFRTDDPAAFAAALAPAYPIAATPQRSGDVLLTYQERAAESH